MDESTEDRIYVDNQPDDLKIIREFYRNENSKEAQIYYDNELENALDCNCKLIVIEPKQFGDSLARYIYIGNILEKSAIVSGITSIFSAICIPDRTVVYCPFAAFSLICTTLYGLTWSSDKCSTYRVVSFDGRKLGEDKELKKLIDCLCIDETPIILCKREHQPKQIYKNLFHRSISLIAAVLSAFKFYELVKLAQSV